MTFYECSPIEFEFTQSLFPIIHQHRLKTLFLVSCFVPWKLMDSRELSSSFTSRRLSRARFKFYHFIKMLHLIIFTNQNNSKTSSQQRYLQSTATVQRTLIVELISFALASAAAPASAILFSNKSTFVSVECV